MIEDYSEEEFFYTDDVEIGEEETDSPIEDYIEPEIVEEESFPQEETILVEAETFEDPEEGKFIPDDEQQPEDETYTEIPAEADESVEIGIEEDEITEPEVNYSDNYIAASADPETGETQNEDLSEYYESILAYLDDAPTVQDIQQLQANISTLTERVNTLNQNLVQHEQNIGSYDLIIISVSCAILGAIVGSLVLSKIF